MLSLCPITLSLNAGVEFKGWNKWYDTKVKPSECEEIPLDSESHTSTLLTNFLTSNLGAEDSKPIVFFIHGYRFVSTLPNHDMFDLTKDVTSKELFLKLSTVNINRP